MRTVWKLAGVLAWLSARAAQAAEGPPPVGTGAVVLPVEIRQEQTLYNFQSKAGVPISDTAGVPPGSNGDMPTGQNESGSNNRPSKGQFAGLVSFGGVPGLSQADWQAVASSAVLNAGTNALSGELAVQMRLPVARSNGVVVMALCRAAVGAPFLSRQVSFAFGSIVQAPVTDENGRLLDTNALRQAYWLPEPYTTNNHVGAGYYWSPYARKVFAIQAGPIVITWKRAQPFASDNLPASYFNANGYANFETNGTDNIYLLHTVRYVVSGTAVKPPRRMYWTEREYGNLSKPVIVPPSLGINIAFNNNFPRTVAKEHVGIGQSSPMEGTGFSDLPRLRTLWYNATPPSICAYNVEGRVFVELLREASDGKIPQHLGFEIVDVFQQPSPADVEINLGEQITPPSGFIGDLLPVPIESPSPDKTYTFSHVVPGRDQKEYYATRETTHLNDYLVNWMQQGLEGLKWPHVLARYRLVWPADPSRYSHYVRPLARTEDEARRTAIPLPTQNAPSIAYQDALDRPRAKLTEEFKFFTWLDREHPAHRTLLQFSAGEDYVGFERVFSWLDVNLKTTNFAGTVAEELSSWDPNSQSFAWPDELAAPRVVRQTVNVGDRINAPMGEAGVDGAGYIAGFINTNVGNLYDPNSYSDPFVAGFEAANLGAIIPVNAIPGRNVLEVWWFRTNRPTAGFNVGNTEKGFASLLWPSVLGRYEIQWPWGAPEIVLASKLGSGSPPDSFQARGTVYYQNNPALPGYNPNEEHAIIQAGTAYATRDDLNLTNEIGYSSAPFVLVSYYAEDKRPAMTAYRVLRENPEAGLVFDYVVSAGQRIQPPPPLAFLGKPVEGRGADAVNYNHEPEHTGGDWPGNWREERDRSGEFAHYKRFTYRDRKEDFWVYRGPHAGLPLLRLGTYNSATETIDPPAEAIAVVSLPFSYRLHVSRQEEYVTLSAPEGLPSWLRLQGFSLEGTPDTAAVGVQNVTLVLEDNNDHTRVTNSLAIRVEINGSPSGQGPLQIASFNPHTEILTVYSNRAPFLAVSPTPTNSFTMRYYYRTEPSFAWPGLANPPAAGSIVPYLRRYDAGLGAFTGNGHSPDAPALDIVYRPFWPERDPKDSARPLPRMPFSYTLAGDNPFGLPQLRGMASARLLYQQSMAANMAVLRPSVVLHDPTRQKSSSLASLGLERLPGGLQTDYYQGKYYFPNLPPHLASRLFFDPNRGDKGSLVFKGEYRADLLGESYFLLNLLRGSDLAAVKGLCPAWDVREYNAWTGLVDTLVTELETFREDPSHLGAYSPDPHLRQPVGIQDTATINNDEIAVDSYAASATGPGQGYVTLVEAGGRAFTNPGDPVSLHVFRVGESLHTGQSKVITSANPLSELVTFEHSVDLAGSSDDFEYEWKIASPVDGVQPPSDATMSQYLPLAAGMDLPRQTLGGAGIRALCDNYVVMRYRPKSESHPLRNQWSDWTEPRLAEGWIKRVLAGLNPFNQRVRDLFNNRVNTDVSMLTQAGHRWEGDIALNLDTINNYGLIEIYETVLRRGRLLSLEAGINFGPANDALLLAAGYLNDLYMMEGNEAWADAANPTIGIGTKDHTYGDIATALFAFRGQVPSLLEEELTLLRGRDDFMQPGVQLAPVYNRLIWNYTRGIDAGEVIYALNYNIQEDPNSSPDGNIDAADAARMFPQGHGDAYGHYLTALKVYYSLLLNSCFDWVPRSEAVNVLGQPVQVDYLDERKFAAAAAALARAGRQTFDLTWRRDYQSVRETGWEHFAPTRENTQRKVPTTRFWGMDHWASRTGQGTYLNWVVGNAVLPDVDTDPTHEGIRKIDRTNVPELQELVSLEADLQTAMNNAEGGLSPVGLPEGSLAFDINPSALVGTDNGTHFEQIFNRAKVALNNAVVSFDDAKGVNALMRSEQDSLVEFQAAVARQEQAYNASLIEIYGSPYPDDLGPGRTYKQDYTGPDLIHFSYVDTPELSYPGLLQPEEDVTFRIDVQNFTPSYLSGPKNRFDFVTTALNSNALYTDSKYVTFTLDAHGYFKKPGVWTSKRPAPGKLQEAIAKVILARNAALRALTEDVHAKYRLDTRLALFNAQISHDQGRQEWNETRAITQLSIESAVFAAKMFKLSSDIWGHGVENAAEAGLQAIPDSMIGGLAVGGDVLSAAQGAILAAAVTSRAAYSFAGFAKEFAVGAYQVAKEGGMRLNEVRNIEPLKRDMDYKKEVWELEQLLLDLQDCLFTINQRIQELDDARRQYREVLSRGERIQQERETFRRRAAAVIQGYRTRDAAFRIFRNEKLERYKTLFDLSARYSLLAANAYDYETGLLNTSRGRSFIKRIVNSRALGVVRNGEPQYAGSDTGDPGLSSALAEMKADWDVLRGRLGFNNPDAYGTTASLRTEFLRILPTTDGDPNWRDALHLARRSNLLEDEDVRRFCMQLDSGDGLSVPGLVFTFSTTIAEGFNLFGRELAAGDHAFSPSSFATKIHGVGVALEGYRGMDNPSGNSGAVSGAGGASPSDPSGWFLDPLALSATPYIYLVPAGVDSMRSPPLGDASNIRGWIVEDVAIPMPFNLGSSDFSTRDIWHSGDTLTEQLFSIRKHQGFRPVSDASLFSRDLYGASGTLLRSQFTNNRLVGRSVWNSRWKLVIPGKTLLNDPNEGLDRFIQTVRDIKLHFVTYSYSGN